MAKYEKGSFITVPNREHLIGLDPSAQVIYIWLCYHQNQDGTCYPSRATIAKECGFSSVRTVDKFLETLILSGLVVKEKRFKKNEQLSNEYSLPILEIPSANYALPSAKNDTTPSAKNDTQNSIHITQSNNYSADAEKVPLKPLKGKMKISPLNPAHNTLRPLVIKALEPLHPLESKRWYANTTEQKAVDALIDWLGEKKLMRFAEIWPVAVKEAFAPQAYKPSAILAKWPQIEKFLVERKKNGSPVSGGSQTMGSVAEMIQ